jgi:hypothetical protein
MGVSDDGLSEIWKEPTGLTESGTQGAEEFFLNSLTLELGTLRAFRSIGNYQSTLCKIPEDRKYKVGKLWLVTISYLWNISKVIFFY